MLAPMRGDGGPAGDVTGARIARAMRAIVLLALAVGSTAAPAAAASTASPAVQAASASGTPTIPPPEPEPLACTPGTAQIFCTTRAETCETIGGVRTCVVRRATCLQIRGFKRCVVTTSTCRTVTSPLTGRSRTTCVPGGISFPRNVASIATGSIPRFTLAPSRSTLQRSPTARRQRATTLVSTTTAAAPPVTSAVASPGPTVPPGAAIGALVLVLALVGLTISRRHPRSGG